MKNPLPALFLLALAPTGVQAQEQPQIRQLGAVTATTSELRSIMGVSVLSDGRILVNDMRSRRVLLFDPTLSTFTVVADSTSATGNAYSGMLAGLISFRGDSTLFVDAMSMSMLVLTPEGSVGRVMSIPRSHDAGSFAGGPLGAAQYDPAGRLVYREPAAFVRNIRITGGGASAAPPEQPDSVPLLRVDLATRGLDTVTFIRVPKLNMRINRNESGAVTMESEINPLPLVDEWTILPDGSIAVVRGSDYRVEYFPAEGARTSVRVPFEWQRLSDEDKVTFMDSVKVAFERRMAAGELAVPGMAMGGGGQRITIQQGGPGGPGGPGRRGAGAGAATGMPQPRFNFIPPEQLPDYRPPFFAGALRADTDGNLWVATTRAAGGRPVYDVIDRNGQLIDRVQVPEGRAIVGFAPGVVYLSSRDGEQARLERAALR